MPPQRKFPGSATVRVASHGNFGAEVCRRGLTVRSIYCLLDLCYPVIKIEEWVSFGKQKKLKWGTN